MGYAYHAHYVDWFEEARTEALRDLGLPYSELENEGVTLVVVDLAVRYHKPARYDDMVQVVTTLESAAPRVRVRFDYVVSDHPTGDKIATGHVTLCFFSPARGRPIAAPERVLAVFEGISGD